MAKIIIKFLSLLLQLFFKFINFKKCMTIKTTDNMLRIVNANNVKEMNSYSLFSKMHL